MQVGVWLQVSTPLQVGHPLHVLVCKPHETVFSHVACPAAHVGPVPQVVIGAQV